MWTTIAGKPGSPGKVDGWSDQSRFGDIHSICLAENGNLYVTDPHNNVVREIATDKSFEREIQAVLSNSRVPGCLGKIVCQYLGSILTYTTTIGNGKRKCVNGGGKAVSFVSPEGIAALCRYVFITDNVNRRMRVINIDTKHVFVLRDKNGKMISMEPALMLITGRKNDLIIKSKMRRGWTFVRLSINPKLGICEDITKTTPAYFAKIVNRKKEQLKNISAMRDWKPKAFLFNYYCMDTENEIVYYTPPSNTVCVKCFSYKA